jgi:CRP/FNR family transcriptional regulator
MNFLSPGYCNSCPARKSTLCGSVNDAELKQLKAIAKQLTLEEGEYLFHQHSEAKHVYNVTSGALIFERTSAEGNRQVLAFVFPGNYIGITNSDFFEYNVRSLTPVTLCEFPLRKFMALADQLPKLKKSMETIRDNVLARALDQIFTLGQKKAHERVCFLIMQLFERQQQEKNSTLELVMQRQDIANYLGLTTETVSRAFTKLKTDGLLEVNGNSIKIVDIETVERLARAN